MTQPAEVRLTTEAAMNAAMTALTNDIAAAKWVRGSLVLNDDLDLKTTAGLYIANVSSVSASIVNKPSWFNSNAFSVEVVPVSESSGIYEQTARQMDVDGTWREAQRTSLSSVFNPWVHKTSQWKGEAFKTGDSLATLITEGLRFTPNTTIAASILGKPADATTYPFYVRTKTLSVGSGIRHQVMVQWSEEGPQKWERLSLSNIYPAWQPVTIPRWEGTALAAGDSLGALTADSLHYAGTTTIAKGVTDRPTDSSTYPFYVRTTEIATGSNGISHQTMVQWSAEGPQKWERISLAYSYPAWQRITVPTWDYGKGVQFFGDSLVEQGFANYITGLNGTVTNRGRSGDSSNDVLLRAGIIKLYATPVGGSIPAEKTAVTLNLYGRKLTTRGPRSFAFTWAGVPGNLHHTSGDTWTFTRTTAGEAVTISAPTQLVSDQVPPKQATLGFFFGTNDAWHGGHAPDPDMATHIKANYQRAIDSVTAEPERHVLIFGMITSRSTVKGDSLDTLVNQEVNPYCATSAPAYYVSMQDYMVNQAMTDLAMTPTPQDTAAAADGLIPPSLYFDDLHLIQGAQQAFAENRVKPAIQERGWA